MGVLGIIIDKCIRSQSNKKDLPETLLAKVKTKVSQCIEKKKSKTTENKENKAVKEASKGLHDRYVITPID